MNSCSEDISSYDSTFDLDCPGQPYCWCLSTLEKQSHVLPQGRLPSDLIIQILTGILQALYPLHHQHHRPHGDLIINNVYVNENGVVILGNAKPTSDEDIRRDIRQFGRIFEKLVLGGSTKSSDAYLGPASCARLTHECSQLLALLLNPHEAHSRPTVVELLDHPLFSTRPKRSLFTEAYRRRKTRLDKANKQSKDATQQIAAERGNNVSPTLSCHSVATTASSDFTFSSATTASISPSYSQRTQSPIQSSNGEYHLSDRGRHRTCKRIRQWLTHLTDNLDVEGPSMTAPRSDLVSSRGGGVTSHVSRTTIRGGSSIAGSHMSEHGEHERTLQSIRSANIALLNQNNVSLSSYQVESTNITPIYPSTTKVSPTSISLLGSPSIGETPTIAKELRRTLQKGEREHAAQLQQMQHFHEAGIVVGLGTPQTSPVSLEGLLQQVNEEEIEGRNNCPQFIDDGLITAQPQSHVVATTNALHDITNQRNSTKPEEGKTRYPEVGMYATNYDFLVPTPHRHPFSVTSMTTSTDNTQSGRSIVCHSQLAAVLLMKREDDLASDTLSTLDHTENNIAVLKHMQQAMKEYSHTVGKDLMDTIQNSTFSSPCHDLLVSNSNDALDQLDGSNNNSGPNSVSSNPATCRDTSLRVVGELEPTDDSDCRTSSSGHYVRFYNNDSSPNPHQLSVNGPQLTWVREKVNKTKLDYEKARHLSPPTCKDGKSRKSKRYMHHQRTASAPDSIKSATPQSGRRRTGNGSEAHAERTGEVNRSGSLSSCDTSQSSSLSTALDEDTYYNDQNNGSMSSVIHADAAGSSYTAESEGTQGYERPLNTLLLYKTHDHPTTTTIQQSTPPPPFFNDQLTESTDHHLTPEVCNESEIAKQHTSTIDDDETAELQHFIQTEPQSVPHQELAHHAQPTRGACKTQNSGATPPLANMWCQQTPIEHQVLEEQQAAVPQQTNQAIGQQPTAQPNQCNLVEPTGEQRIVQSYPPSSETGEWDTSMASNMSICGTEHSVNVTPTLHDASAVTTTTTTTTAHSNSHSRRSNATPSMHESSGHLHSHTTGTDISRSTATHSSTGLCLHEDCLHTQPLVGKGTKSRRCTKKDGRKQQSNSTKKRKKKLHHKSAAEREECLQQQADGHSQTPADNKKWAEGVYEQLDLLSKINRSHEHIQCTSSPRNFGVEDGYSYAVNTSSHSTHQFTDSNLNLELSSNCGNIDLNITPNNQCIPSITSLTTPQGLSPMPYQDIPQPQPQQLLTPQPHPVPNPTPQQHGHDERKPSLEEEDVSKDFTGVDFPISGAIASTPGVLTTTNSSHNKGSPKDHTSEPLTRKGASQQQHEQCPHYPHCFHCETNKDCHAHLNEILQAAGNADQTHVDTVPSTWMQAYQLAEELKTQVNSCIEAHKAQYLRLAKQALERQSPH